MVLLKAGQARCLLRTDPTKWFRDAAVDERDRALLDAEQVNWLDYNQGSYLRKIFHMRAGQQFETTEWVVESDDHCKEIVRSAGGGLYGYELAPTAPAHWASVTVNVNVQGTRSADFDWGYLSTRPSNIRIFKGPPESCHIHLWDAMILRDCTPNTDTLSEVESIASRKWDILVMKMCEDYDHPWVVCTVKDAGPNNTSQHDCQDPTQCGYVFAT